MTHGSRIVVKCPDCGDARVAPEEVTVRNSPDRDSGSYRFTCPNCRLTAFGESAMRALMDAVDAGAGFEEWTKPLERHEQPTGPVFTLADVFELHLLLLDPDWFDDFIRASA
jgi:predicted RNA-binding Zn-ribbon protein involved in translation (DUF1610 family)